MNPLTTPDIVPESDLAALYAAQLAERIKQRQERAHNAQMRVYRKAIKENGKAK